MITPTDIQNKVFSRAVRGYKEEDVDHFLDLITADYERLIEENNDLQVQVSDLLGRLNEFKNSEENVLKTLEAAQALMNDIAVSAEKRADILIKNAELDAEQIQRQARESVERLKEEETTLARRVASVRSRFRSMLESELDRFDLLSEEIFGAGHQSSFAAPLSPDTKAPSSFRNRTLRGDELFKTVTNLRGEE